VLPQLRPRSHSSSSGRAFGWGHQRAFGSRNFVWPGCWVGPIWACSGRGTCRSQGDPCFVRQLLLNVAFSMGEPLLNVGLRHWLVDGFLHKEFFVYFASHLAPVPVPGRWFLCVCWCLTSIPHATREKQLSIQSDPLTFDLRNLLTIHDSPTATRKHDKSWTTTQFSVLYVASQPAGQPPPARPLALCPSRSLSPPLRPALMSNDPPLSPLPHPSSSHPVQTTKSYR